ncbi:MAG: TonB-dependent receptor domain-containing protein [Bacteroidia bacterium]
MIILRTLYLLFLLLVFAITSHAQSFTISGIISEQGSGETLPGVSVYCPQSKTGNSSNNYGFYSVTLQGDTTQLIFTFLGYAPQQVKVSKNSTARLDIQLRKAELELKTVEITDTREEKISEVSQMSRIEIPIEQIKKIPALFGEKDVLKVIQLLPGVQKGSEGSSGFYVRGGGPDQNLIILDDAVVYNANHLFGFFSIFNGDALKSVELTKGGFPARYGGRLSSVLEMQMKDGNKEQLHGEAGIGIISSRLTLEGPIQKNKSSFLVSGRRTYIDALVYPFLPAESKGGYFFYDFNAKAHFILNENDRLYVSGYFGKDKFYFKSTGEDKSVSKGSFLWQNATATARFNHIINKKAFSNTSLIFSRYNLGINSVEESENGDSFELNFSSGIRDWTLKHDFDYFPNTKHHIRMGAAATYHRFTPNAIVVKGDGGLGDSDESEIYDCIENGVYVEDDWTLNDKIKVSLGLRGSHFLQGKRNYFGIEPRFSGRYLLNDNTSIKASYALMNQYLHLLSNTGIGLPTDLWVPATDRVAPQRSHQVAMGMARDIANPELTLSAEAYYKTMNNIIGYKEGASFLSAFEYGGAETISWQDNVTPGQGQSYGAELMVQRKTGKLTGWVGYTLSWTTQQFEELNNGEAFFARYDRRHDLSIVAIYELKPSLTLSATWIYGTGQAVTLPLAQYQVNPHDPATNGNPAYFIYPEDFGAKNSFRMAPYHRLDIAAQWHKKLKRSERTFELGVYNAYNRQNPFFYFIDSKADGTRYLSQISLFPILPSISWTYKF